MFGERTLSVLLRSSSYFVYRYFTFNVRSGTTCGINRFEAGHHLNKSLLRHRPFFGVDAITDALTIDISLNQTGFFQFLLMLAHRTLREG